MPCRAAAARRRRELRANAVAGAARIGQTDAGRGHRRRSIAPRLMRLLGDEACDHRVHPSRVVLLKRALQDLVDVPVLSMPALLGCEIEQRAYGGAFDYSRGG